MLLCGAPACCILLDLLCHVSQQNPLSRAQTHTQTQLGEAARCPSLGQRAEAGGRPAAAERRASGFNEAPTPLDLREVSQSSAVESTDGLWDGFVGARA